MVLNGKRKYILQSIVSECSKYAARMESAYKKFHAKRKVFAENAEKK